MNALLHPQPPPNKVKIRADNEEDLHNVADHIKEHDASYHPRVIIDKGLLQIFFKKAPDQGMRRLIELNIHEICTDAEITITWEVANYEDTNS